MSKRGGFPGMGGFGGMNINQLMKEAKKMQADIEKSQTELQAKECNSWWRCCICKSNWFKRNKRNNNKKRCCRSRRC